MANKRMLGSLLLVALAAAAAWAAAFFSNTGGETINYSGGGWMRETLQWDSRNKRFLVSRMEGGVSEIVSAGPGKFTEKIVVTLPESLKGNSTLGIRVDLPRNRLLAVVADAFGRSFSGLAAYDLTSWEQLFFTKLESPGKKRLGDDVAVDLQGNSYVTDAQENLIWKVSKSGDRVSIISSPEFSSKPHKLPVYIAGLNGIDHHPGGFLLVAHTTSGALFKVALDGSTVETVDGVSVAGADGMVLMPGDPSKLVVAGIPARLVETSDGWKSAKVTDKFYGPFYRLLTSVAVRDDDSKVFANYILGWKSFTIKEAVFKPVSQ